MPSFGTLLILLVDSMSSGRLRVPTSGKHLRHFTAPTGATDTISHSDCKPKYHAQTVPLHCVHFVRGSVLAREPWSSFRVIDSQVLWHDAAGVEVELQGVVQDEETDVLMGVKEVHDEYSCDIMGGTWR